VSQYLDLQLWESGVMSWHVPSLPMFNFDFLEASNLWSGRKKKEDMDERTLLASICIYLAYSIPSILRNVAESGDNARADQVRYTI
jgi:hypothetical protein